MGFDDPDFLVMSFSPSRLRPQTNMTDCCVSLRPPLGCQRVASHCAHFRAAESEDTIGKGGAAAVRISAAAAMSRGEETVDTEFQPHDDDGGYDGEFLHVTSTVSCCLLREGTRVVSFACVTHKTGSGPESTRLHSNLNLSCTLTSGEQQRSIAT